MQQNGRHLRLRGVAGQPGDHVALTETADGGSLADLFRRRYDEMVRVAFLLVGSNAIAEELVQDAFVRVGKRWRWVREPDAYLRTSVVNACRSWGRRRVREVPLTTDLATIDPDVRELLDALASLPNDQRAAIVLRFYCGMPDAAIAAVIGCKVATVRSHVHRGLRALREVIPR